MPVAAQIALAIEERCEASSRRFDLHFTARQDLRLNNWRKNVFDPAVRTTGLVGLGRMICAIPQRHSLFRGRM